MDTLGPYEIYGKYLIGNFCLGKSPCEHVVINVETGKKSILDAHIILQLLDKANVKSDHFESFRGSKKSYSKFGKLLISHNCHESLTPCEHKVYDLESEHLTMMDSFTILGLLDTGGHRSAHFEKHRGILNKYSKAKIGDAYIYEDYWKRFAHIWKTGTTIRMLGRL